MNSQNNSPNSKQYDTGLVWFRRDLRVDDNAALYHALKRCKKVYAVFVFDRAILDTLPVQDRRVEFIRETLLELSGKLSQLAHQNKSEVQNSKGLLVCHALATQEIPKLAKSLGVQAVFCNHDYEPQAIARDTTVLGKLAHFGIAFHSFKDHVIFERNELLTQQGRPYGVFTPYKNAWLKKLGERTDNFYLKPYPVKAYASAMTNVTSKYTIAVASLMMPELLEIGFERTNLKASSKYQQVPVVPKHCLKIFLSA
jgi:deoxyribodipyrimidine photo-lyase